MKYLSTSDLAKAAGVHPNTVRRYAERGIIPPVKRNPANGYRRFTPFHLDCLRLAWQVYGNPYPSKGIYQSGKAVVATAVSNNLGGALELAYNHLALVQSERVQAEAAAALMERWAKGVPADATSQPLRIGQVAKLLGVSIDVVRSWDRNGLIDVPRNPANGYRRYGAAEISRLRVIRMLSRAGYSHAAILRMMIQLDSGDATNLRRALDTPRPDENIYTAADHWLSTLAQEEQRARTLISLIEEMIQKQVEA